MRSIKSTRGGGRGMTEVQRSVWIKSLPACSQINQSKQDLAGTTYLTSQQHVEASHARVKRDRGFTTRNLFVDSDKSFRNIVSGVVAHESVNADQAVKVGTKIIESMQKKPITDHYFKRNEQAITLGSFSKLDLTTKKRDCWNRSSDLLSKTYVDRSQRKSEHWRHFFLWALYVSNSTIREPRCSQTSEQGCIGRLFVE